MEPRSKRLAKTAKLLMAMSFGLLMTSVMLLAVFLAELKPILGESVGLLFFSALLAAFSFLYHLQYVRLQCLAVKEALREHIDERQTKQVNGEA
jgi:hypothetical protein